MLRFSAIPFQNVLLNSHLIHRSYIFKFHLIKFQFTKPILCVYVPSRCDIINHYCLVEFIFSCPIIHQNYVLSLTV